MDQELEAAIDQAGRDLVFDVVLTHGWSRGDSIPKYVWWDAVKVATTMRQGTAFD